MTTTAPAPGVLTPVEHDCIARLRDTTLYDDACVFAREWGERPDDRGRLRVVSENQLQGLLRFSTTWGVIRSFVNHQANREAHSARPFYVALRTWLDSLPPRLAAWNLPERGQTRKERDAWREAVCGPLARAFVEHVVAEIRYRDGCRRAGLHVPPNEPMEAAQP